LTSQSFDIESIWSRLFKKCVVGTNFDIYVFISFYCICIVFNLFSSRL